MFDINNEKNKSAVILNPERSEWVSRSHVTGVEPVVNDGAKTQYYSVKRDLYGPSLRSTLKIPTLAFLLSLNLSTAFADCKCLLSGADKKTLTIKGCSAISSSSCKSQKKTANNIRIGTDVTSIGQYAFRNATSLKSISIPKGVTSIGKEAFAYSGLKSITIPEGVTSIGWGAFNSASSLFRITIPDSVTSIGHEAFAHTGLKSITIPKGVTSIGYGAFAGTSKLTSITIPDSVTSIGNYAFKGTSLTSIKIPDSVTSIGSNAFQDASRLTSITIPDSVTSIGTSTFAHTGLTSITIPEGVTSIGDGVFNGTSKLTSITIPDNIDTKNWYAGVFAGLPGKTKIVCQGDLNTCYENLAKYFSEETCPQNLKAAGKGNLCSCSDSNYCISPDRIIKATDSSQCTGNYGWSGAGCSRKNPDGSVPCASGFVEWDKECLLGSKTTCKNADLLWNGSSCVKSCASGFVEWDNECLSEYPFAKKRWTPAEANEWLHDGNDNFVVITFKK